MTRRFKTEPVSARMMIKLTERAAMPHGDYSKQERAVRILLHWWAQGHNPARNVATCRQSSGTGVQPANEHAHCSSPIASPATAPARR